MATDVIPAKYKRILKLIKINTQKPISVIRNDFLKEYERTGDFQQALLDLHHRYVEETEGQKLWEI